MLNNNILYSSSDASNKYEVGEIEDIPASSRQPRPGGPASGSSGMNVPLNTRRDRDPISQGNKPRSGAPSKGTSSMSTSATGTGIGEDLSITDYLGSLVNASSGYTGTWAGSANRLHANRGWPARSSSTGKYLE